MTHYGLLFYKHFSYQICCTQPPAVVHYSDAHYGRGTGLILLDQLACTGTETRLIDCRHGDINNTQSGCGHDDDAGVACSLRELIHYALHD